MICTKCDNVLMLSASGHYPQSGKCYNCRQNKVKPTVYHVNSNDYMGLTEIYAKIPFLYGNKLNFEQKFQGRERTRELVRIRDNHTCQSCGKIWQFSQRRFDCHHIDGNCGIKTRNYDKLNDLDTLITLCHKCHLGLETIRKKISIKLSRYYQHLSIDNS